MIPNITITEKDYTQTDFYRGSSIQKKGYYLFINDIFIIRKDSHTIAKHIGNQILTNKDFICHYAAVYNTPFEIVDMLVNRNFNFLDTSLTKETTLNDKTRYIFSGNVDKVSCTFRFTIINKEFADKLVEYIVKVKKTKNISIDISLHFTQKSKKGRTYEN